MKSTIDAVCDAAELPISIILVAVGDQDSTTRNFRALDGDFDADKGETSKLIHSKTGKPCARDIVQFVPFRKYRKDFKGLARELLAELAKQIKDYFVSQGIYPNPMKIGLRGNRTKKEDMVLKLD